MGKVSQGQGGTPHAPKKLKPRAADVIYENTVKRTDTLSAGEKNLTDNATLNTVPYKKSKTVKPTPVEDVEDRSGYNCSDCKGEGLVMQGTKHVICEKCSGTGKV